MWEIWEEIFGDSTLGDSTPKNLTGNWTGKKIFTAYTGDSDRLKIFYPPDVTLEKDSGNYEILLFGTADREHPVTRAWLAENYRYYEAEHEGYADEVRPLVVPKYRYDNFRAGARSLGRDTTAFDIVPNVLASIPPAKPRVSRACSWSSPASLSGAVSVHSRPPCTSRC